MNNNNYTSNKNKTYALVVGIVIAFFVGLFLGIQYEGHKLEEILKTTQVVSPKPFATQKLNKEFNFSIKDATGHEVTKLKYIIQDANLMNQIILNGQPYNSVAGKTFVILNLKLVNTSNQGIQFPTRDYIRLSTNKGHDWYAADIHNDPVQIQAISTKFTRIGFPIDADTKNIWLQAGEVNGKKDLIKLNLK